MSRLRITKKLLLVATLAAWCQSSVSARVHEDERVLFFPTYAVQSDTHWIVRVHGWVHEPEERRVLGAILRRAIPIDRGALTPAEREVYRERTRYFLPDNERGKVVTVQAGGLRRTAPPTAANGHFKLTWQINHREFSALKLSNQCIEVSALLDTNDTRAFTGTIHVLSNTGLSVISDIDDTIKITEVRDRGAMLLNTFCRPFRAAPGMARFYQELEKRGAQFHYVSASPWQLYPPLAEFVRKEGFPAGTFHMKDFRVKDSTFLALLSDPIGYKTRILQPLIWAFPRRDFILIGDSGEKDPEVYASLAREYPQVRAILIRNVTGEGRESERYRKLYDGIEAKRWHVFDNPSELPKEIP